MTNKDRLDTESYSETPDARNGNAKFRPKATRAIALATLMVGVLATLVVVRQTCRRYPTASADRSDSTR